MTAACTANPDPDPNTSANLREQRVRQLHVLQPVGDQLHGRRARQQVGKPQARATSDTRAARLHPIHARLHRASVRTAGRARGGGASLVRTGRDATLVEG